MSELSVDRIERYTEGESAEDLKTGDFLLTHGDYFFSKLIRFGQRLRFQSEHAYYNHAALVVYTPDGDLVEALGKGVVATHLISRYEPKDYTVVRIVASEEDREQIAKYAQEVLDARSSYGWLTILALALTLATGSKLVFGMVESAICSGFVSEAIVRAGYVFERPPAYMMPADLTKVFSIHP